MLKLLSLKICSCFVSYHHLHKRLYFFKMRRRKIVIASVVLFIVLCKFQTEAGIHNSDKNLTNLKELQDIESKFEDSHKIILEILNQLTLMKKEQKEFETQLGDFLKTTQNATASMKKMLNDHKRMEIEVNKMPTVIHRFQVLFEKWLKDVKKLLAPNNNVDQVNFCKPIIRELDLMVVHLKEITQKFVDGVKQCNAFGNIMLEMSTVNSNITDCLNRIGTTTKIIGEQVSKIGDPITIVLERMGDIWQNTISKQTDISFIKTIKLLLTKVQALVTDSSLQASSGEKLKAMGNINENENIEEKAVNKKGEGSPENEKTIKIDKIASKWELENIDNGLGELKEDIEKLSLDLKEVRTLVVQFESVSKYVLEKGIVPMEIDALSTEMEKIKNDLQASATKAENMEPDHAKGIRDLAQKISDLSDNTLELAKQLERSGNKLLQNGENLENDQKYTQKHKTKYDLVGKILKGTGMQIKEIGPKFEKVGESFSNLGKIIRGNYERSLDNLGQSIKQNAVHLKVHGDKAKHLGDKILILKANEREAGLDKASLKDFEQIQNDLDEVTKDLEHILKGLEQIKNEHYAVVKVSENNYPNTQNLTQKINKLNENFIKLTEETKKNSEDLQITRKDSPEDIGRSVEKIASRIVGLAKEVVEQADKLDSLGKKLVNNGEVLSNKGSLITELNTRLNIQGNKLQDCGIKLGNIGKAFVNSGEKLESIGNRMGDEYPEVGNSLKNLEKLLRSLGERIQEKGESCQNTGDALQKLKPSEKSFEKDDHDYSNEIDYIQNATIETRKDLEGILQDLNGIMDEQSKLKTDGNDEEIKVIPRMIKDLKNENKMLSDVAKDIISELVSVHRIAEQDYSKNFTSIGNHFVNFGKQILVFIDKLENLGNIFLSFEESLHDKNNLTLGLKAKYINQGKLFERVKQKIRNIGKSFGAIRDTMGPSGSDSAIMEDLREKLIDLGKNIKLKGDNFEGFGAKLQNLVGKKGNGAPKIEIENTAESEIEKKPEYISVTRPDWKIQIRSNEDDNENTKDLDSMIQALGEIDMDFKNMFQDLEGIQEQQGNIEIHAGYRYPEGLQNKLQKVLENSAKLADEANGIEKHVDQVKTSSAAEFGSKVESISYKLFDLVEQILALTRDLEEIGERLLKNGERLLDRGKLTLEINAKIHSQGELFESAGGKAKDIGSRFQIIASKINGFGQRFKNKDSQDVALKLKDSGIKIKDKADFVEEFGVKLQDLVANGGNSNKNDGFDKDLEAVRRALRDIGYGLGEMFKNLEKIQQNQNNEDEEDELHVQTRIEHFIEKCDDLADDAKRAEQQLDNLTTRSANDIGRPLVSIGDDILYLAKRVTDLSEGLNDLGKDILTNGEALRVTGQLTLKIKGNLNIQGKQFKNIKINLQNIGERFEETGDRIEKIGGKLKSDNSKDFSELGKKLKDLSEKIKDNASLAEKYGIQLQGMRPSKRDDNDIEKIHGDNTDNENADDIAEILKALGGIEGSFVQMLKELNEINEEQKDIEDGKDYTYPERGKSLQKLSDLKKVCTDISNDVRVIAEDLDKIQNGPSKNVRKYLEVSGSKMLDLSKRILPLTDKIEDLGGNLLATGQAKENLTANLAERFNKQGRKMEILGNKVESVGGKFQVICGKLRNVGKRLGWDEDPELSNLVETIIAIGWQIKKKGGNVSQIGVQLENLKPEINEDSDNSKNSQTSKQHLTRLNGDLDIIATNLRDMIQNLGELNMGQKLVEKELDMSYTKRGKIPKEIDAMAIKCRILADKAEGIVNDFKITLNEPTSIQTNAIFWSISELGKKVLPLAEMVEDIAMKLLKNGLDLQTKHKLTLLVNAKLNDQGKELKGIYGKLGAIGKQFGNISVTLNKMGHTGNGLEYLGDEIEGKGNSVGEFGSKLQQLKPNVLVVEEMEKENENETEISNKPSRQVDANLNTETAEKKEDEEECACDVSTEVDKIEKELNFMLENFRDLEKDISEMEDDEKKIECGAEDCDHNQIWGEIEIEGKIVGGLIGNTQFILEDLEKVKNEEDKDLGDNLVKIGAKFVKLAERVMSLIGKLETMGISIEKRGEEIRDGGKLNIELRKMFRGQAEKIEDVGMKVRGTGGMFQEIGNTLETIGVNLDQCYLNTEFEKSWKDYLGKSAEETKKLGDQIGARKENFKMMGRMLSELADCHTDKHDEGVENDFDLESLAKMEHENKHIFEEFNGRKYKNIEAEQKSDGGGLQGELQVILDQMKYQKSSLDDA